MLAFFRVVESDNEIAVGYDGYELAVVPRTCPLGQSHLHEVEDFLCEDTN